jgi:hypothetical protein
LGEKLTLLWWLSAAVPSAAMFFPVKRHPHISGIAIGVLLLIIQQGAMHHYVYTQYFGANDPWRLVIQSYAEVWSHHKALFAWSLFQLITGLGAVFAAGLATKRQEINHKNTKTPRSRGETRK